MKLHQPLTPALLALALCLPLAACGDEGENAEKAEQTSTETVQAEKDAAETASQDPSEVAEKETPQSAPPPPEPENSASSNQTQAPPEISLVPIGAGGQPPVDQQSQAAKEAKGNPEAIAIGRQLYVSFNCVGCHFNGGGGMGPPLMDDVWIYGGSMENIASSIREGRPNGMPAFRSMVAGDTVYKLAAYVQSLSETADSESDEDNDNSGKNSGGTEDRQAKDPGGGQ